jgi:hypothetical protein
MVKKAAKKTAKAKMTTREEPAKTKSLARKPPVVHVPIRKVLEKIKAIVDSQREREFLDRCIALRDDRYVVVNARLVRLVKEFAPSLKPRSVSGASASLESTASASDDGETCF